MRLEVVQLFFELNQRLHGSSFLFPAVLICGIAGPEEANNLAGKALRLIRDPFSDAEFGKNSPTCQHNATSANRRFEFNKRSQLFIRTHNETLSVTAMRVHNPDRSPVGINR